MSVVVTGASRGIGKEIALKFLQNGYDVIGVYLNSEYDARVMREKGVNMVKLDISDRELVYKFASKHNDVSILINNAGVAVKELFQNITEEKEKILYGTNLFGTLNMTRAFLPNMINSKFGSVVNISSVFGEIGGSMEVDYSTSKAAIIGLTKALAKEVGPSCIRVNCVTPGIIDTDMNASLSIEDVQALTNEIPLESMGNPADVAEAVYFLASQEAKYITGAVLSVNGGWF